MIYFVWFTQHWNRICVGCWESQDPSISNEIVPFVISRKLLAQIKHTSHTVDEKSDTFEFQPWT